MNRNIILLVFMAAILFTLACIVGELPQPIPTVTPTQPPTQTLTFTPHPTRTAIPIPLPVYPEAEPIPLWVIDFADPILAAVADRKPDFQDDFSLDRRWLNVMSGVILPLKAEIQDGMLFLRLPERTRDSILYHPMLNRRNFVLTLDLRFDHGQPEDTVRFQFDQFAGESVAIDLSNNRNWILHWGVLENLRSMAGIYEHFPPEHIPVTIIMRGTQCAVYFNNDPLTYLENCRSDPTLESYTWITSFRLLRDTRLAVSVNFDNLKLWDLDKIQNLP